MEKDENKLLISNYSRFYINIQMCKKEKNI